MTVVGLLMKEHRLIERMIGLMRKKLEEIQKGKGVDLAFIDIVVDFITNYADKRHHGKEEYILFRDLEKKEISAAHKRIMDDLLKEHDIGRSYVKKLLAAKEDYLCDDRKGLKEIRESVKVLVKFYSKHIEKEDRRFFMTCIDYFSPRERAVMLKECEDFNRRLNQVGYEEIVEHLEQTIR